MPESVGRLGWNFEFCLRRVESRVELCGHGLA
jgi:hypothetical protein